MSKFVALINGSTGVGKTTAAIAIAKQYKKGVSIDIDTVKHFIKTGVLGEMISYQEEIASTAPSGPHSEYYKTIINAACDTAIRFATAGYAVTISDMIWSDWMVDLYRERLKDYNFFHFLLHLPFSEQKERLVARQKHDKVSRSEEETVRRIEAFSVAIDKMNMDQAIRIEASQLRVEDIVRKVMEQIIQRESSR